MNNNTRQRAPKLIIASALAVRVSVCHACISNSRWAMRRRRTRSAIGMESIPRKEP